jgi:hypothetical protein
MFFVGADLKSKWLPVLDAGIENLNKALRIDPHYGDAMTYMNLLIRYRADPLHTREEYLAGTFRFHVTIATDGHVKSADLISGHPLLVNSAREAVLQYFYQPTLLNGQPIELIATVDVPFHLPGGPGY